MLQSNCGRNGRRSRREVHHFRAGVAEVGGVADRTNKPAVGGLKLRPGRMADAKQKSEHRIYGARLSILLERACVKCRHTPGRYRRTLHCYTEVFPPLPTTQAFLLPSFGSVDDSPSSSQGSGYVTMHVPSGRLKHR